MGSPLGKYSQIVAAGLAVSIVVGAILAHIFAAPLAVDDDSRQFLRLLAGIAVGAVFGAAATANGIKPDIQAAHVRLDAVHAPPSAEATKIMEHENAARGEPS